MFILMKTNVLIASLFLFFSLWSCNRNPESIPSIQRTVRYQLEGCKYDSLTASFCYGPTGKSRLQVNGTLKDSSRWEFAVPDSIYRMTSKVILGSFMPKGSFKDNARIWLHSGDSAVSVSVFDAFVFNESEDLFVKATFEKRDSFINTHRVNDTLTIVLQSFMFDLFVVENVHSDINLIEEMSIEFCSFRDSEHSEKSKALLLQEYLKIIKMNSHSRGLAYVVCQRASDFPNKEYLQQVYDAFSPDIQTCYFGEQMKRYISNFNFFPNNLRLKNCKTGQLEPIIMDHSKPTLIIYSASWCRPCHLLIPLLKKVYADLGSTINMTYVSLDEPESQPQWYELIAAEKIGWKSMLAKDKEQVEQVRQECVVGSIPDMTLVHTDNSMQKIDLRHTEDREMLYKLVGK